MVLDKPIILQQKLGLLISSFVSIAFKNTGVSYEAIKLVTLCFLIDFLHPSPTMDKFFEARDCLDL